MSKLKLRDKIERPAMVSMLTVCIQSVLGGALQNLQYRICTDADPCENGLANI